MTTLNTLCGCVVTFIIMDTISKLFDSAARVKIMKLFLCNPGESFEKSEIIKRAKVTSQAAQKELRLLHSAGFLQKKNFSIDGKPLKSGKPGKKKQVSGFALNPNFEYISLLHRLLISSTPIQSKDVAKRFTKAGNIKLIVLSGVFVEDVDGRIDVLIIGDQLKRGQLKSIIAIIESELGRQLRYTIFTTKDFKYRMSVCDRLIRDVFDYSHEIVVDKMGMRESLKNV